VIKTTSVWIPACAGMTGETSRPIERNCPHAGGVQKQLDFN
jgi:hypothetical protein